MKMKKVKVRRRKVSVKGGRKRRGHKRPNPAFTPANFGLGVFSDMDVLISTTGDAMVNAALAGCTLQDKIIISQVIKVMLRPILSKLSERSKENAVDDIMNGGMSSKDCVCKGECPCHTGLQIAGVLCPTNCPNYGNHFDGCHRCNCPEPDQSVSEAVQ
jgi:hypothetical protein